MEEQDLDESEHGILASFNPRQVDGSTVRDAADPSHRRIRNAESDEDATAIAIATADDDDDDDEEDDEELDDEDLELIAENTGLQGFKKMRKFKRLKRHQEEEQSRMKSAPSTSLDRLFEDDEDREQEARSSARSKLEGPSEDDDDEEEGEIDEQRREKSNQKRYEAPSDDEIAEDDMDDFIVNDEQDEDLMAVRRPRPKKQVVDFQVSEELGISRDSWNLVFELFGDGTDYDWALGDAGEGDAMDGYPARKIVDKKHIDEIYEPAEVVEKMFTGRDDEIRLSDLPERFQLRDTPFRIPDSQEVLREANWIVEHLRNRQFKDGLPDDHPMVQAIAKVLHYMRIDCLEVPFIIRHRVDYFHPVLTPNDIWDISDLDERWNHIINKKMASRSWVPIVPEFDQVFNLVDDEDGVKDLSDYLQQRYKKEMEEWKVKLTESQATQMDTTKSLKRPIRLDTYMLAKEAGLGKLAAKFGITAEQFGINFSENVLQHPVEDPDVAPEILATEFVSEKYFRSASHVLAATRTMISQEIATDLRVRLAMREYMAASARVHVRPTERGKVEIDETHEYYRFKYIRSKPVQELKEHEYLLLDKARREGLITVDLDIDLVSLTRSYEPFFLSDNYSALAEKWNNERRQILNMAFEGSLLPLMKRWLNDKLISQSFDFVANHCRNALYQRLQTKPYEIAVDEDDEIRTPRVFSISCGGGESTTACFGVLLDRKGSVIDFIKLNSVHSKDAEAKSRDLSTLADFLKRYEAPDFVTIAGWSLASRFLFDDLQNTLMNLYDMNERPGIGFVTDEIARVYQNSRRGSQEFPSYPPLLKYCVCLGRFVQEPVFEYAAAFNMDKEILSVKFHVLQDQVPADRLYRALERAMLDTVNEIGLDINRALLSSPAESPLQFVSGLGPRKANSMLAKLRAKGSILESRSELIRELHIGKIIFMNCASFIRINPAYLSGRRDVAEILDTTRIHPEDYDIARKIACDALEVEQHSDEPPSKAVEDVIADPEKLDDLVLEDFANRLFERQGVLKRITLQNICSELRSPFHDNRRPFEPLEKSKIFYMLTGEDDATLRPGTVLGARVVRIKDKLVFVHLDSGLEGVINLKNLSNQLVREPTEVVQINQALTCRVISVNKDRFQVDLDAREIAERPTMYRDPYFDRAAEAADSNQFIGDQDRPAGFTHRPIQHPLFRNVDAKGSEEYLGGAPVGERIFRPSSRGLNKLILSWKVAKGLIQHVTIDEFRKDNELALGHELRIGEQVFSDLDEVSALYVDPMARFVRDLVNYPKFKSGTKSELYAHVEREMMANPKRVPYVIGLSDEPGRFLLVYQMGVRSPTQHESITVSPRGYDFRQENYRDVIKLLNGFKSGASRTPQPTAGGPAPGYRYPGPGYPDARYAGKLPPQPGAMYAPTGYRM